MSTQRLWAQGHISKVVVIACVLLISLAAGLAVSTVSLPLMIALVGGIIVLPILLVKPVWSVYLTFASAMIYFSTFVAGQVLSPVRVLGFVTAGVWIVALVSQPNGLRRLRFLIASNRIAQAMLLLVFAAVLTFFVGYLKFPEATSSPRLKFSQVGYLQQLLSYILLFFATICLVDNERKIMTLLKVMVWASLVGLAYASVKMFSAGDNWYFLDSLGGSRSVRVRITQWYQILMPFLVVWLLSSRTRPIQKLAISLAVTMLLLGMLLSATRAAFLSIVIQLFFYVVWYPRKLGVRRTKIVLAILVVGFFILVVFLPFVPLRFRDISFRHLEWMPVIGSEFELGDSRIAQYLDIASIYIRDLNWFTGIGFGHFEAIFHYEYVAPPAVLGWIWTDAHSLFITLPLEMGVLGVVVLWLLVSGIKTQLGRALRASSALGNNLYELSVGCTASLFSFMPSLLFQGPPLLDRNFYFVMAVISVLGLLCTKTQKGTLLNKPRGLVSKASDISTQPDLK